MLVWNPNGSRKRGYPRHDWTSKLVAYTRFQQLADWQMLAQDRPLWMQLSDDFVNKVLLHALILLVSHCLRPKGGCLRTCRRKVKKVMMMMMMMTNQQRSVPIHARMRDTMRKQKHVVLTYMPSLLDLRFVDDIPFFARTAAEAMALLDGGPCELYNIGGVLNAAAAAVQTSEVQLHDQPFKFQVHASRSPTSCCSCSTGFSR